jgi:chorismate mutase
MTAADAPHEDQQPASRDARSSEHAVRSGRERIDALDAQIAQLVLHRNEVSRQIQAARVAGGGGRVDLRRETEIIARYDAALGRPGTAIAMALLELGRRPV